MCSLTGISVLLKVYFSAWASESILFRSNFFPISGGSWLRKVRKKTFWDLQEQNRTILTGTGIGDVVVFPPHDFLGRNEEEIFALFTIDLKKHLGYCARFVCTRLPRLVKDHSLIAPHDP